MSLEQYLEDEEIAGNAAHAARHKAMGNIVTATTNLTGGISLSVGGKRYLQQQSTLVPIGDLALCSISATANPTRGFTRAMDFDIGAVKARFYNGTTTQQDGCYAGVAMAGTNDPYGSSATWTVLTVNGSQSFSTPAGSGTIPEHTFGVVDSDIAYLQGSAGQLLLGRYFTPISNNTRFAHPTRSSPTLAADGVFFYYQIGNGVTSPNGFGKTDIGSGPAMDLYVYPKSSIRSLVVGGGSTASGQGDSATLGWVRRFGKLAELAGKPFATKNTGHPGATTDSSLVRMNQAIAAYKPTYAAWFAFSPNGSPTLTAVPKIKAQTLAFIEQCANVGTIPVLVAFQPPAAQAQATKDCCQAVNDFCRELAANGAAILIDFQLLFGGSTTATTWADAADTADSTHPSAQGHGKAAQLLFDAIF